MESSNHEKLVFKAKMAMTANRYYDMTAVMKILADSFDMSEDERLLLHISYKGQFQERRESLKNLNEHLNDAIKKESRTKIAVITDFKNEILKEVYAICNEAITFFNDLININDKLTEKNVHLLMMKGDFYRYLHECNPTEYISDMAKVSYENARKLDHILNDTNAIKLDLIYRYALFLHRHLNDTTSAMSLLDEAIYKANEELKRDAALSTTEIREMTGEMNMLANRIRPPSPFMNTQQILSLPSSTSQIQSGDVSPDMFEEELEPASNFLQDLFAALSQADNQFSQWFFNF